MHGQTPEAAAVRHEIGNQIRTLLGSVGEADLATLVNRAVNGVMAVVHSAMQADASSHAGTVRKPAA